MLRKYLTLVAFVAIANSAWAIKPVPVVSASSSYGSVLPKVDEATGFHVYTLKHGDTTVRVAPAAGFNVFSIVSDGVEYLRVPEDFDRLKGVGYGTPILYPMPNRVRGAQFDFGGETYKFPPNGRGNFIHGLVHSVAWSVQTAKSTNEFSELVCSLSFHKGSELHKRFPFVHEISIAVRVSEGGVRWDYTVSNRGDKPVPFGLALHPYFNYLGDRDKTFLQVRAESLMESDKQLPSGKLLSLDGHALDAREPVSLAGYKADDVFFGMQQDHAAAIDYRDKARKVTFHTSKEFTHCVVYTPDRPFLCVENQTCSTDAHNLASKGLNSVAHLQECEPGEDMSGWVEYRFEST